MNAPISKTGLVAEDTPPLKGAGHWSWYIAATALVIVLAVPFLLVDVPPVMDYPNHLARYFVLAHPDHPILSQMYAPHWTILPNLGMDVIGSGLLRVTDVHVGGRLLLALSLFAPVIGVVVYHRVAFGGRSYWPLASGLVAYNGVFFLGFMNFLLSLGLALIGSAGWIALDRRKYATAKIVVGALAGATIFFCHIFGVILFALLIGGYELDRLWRSWRSGALTLREAATVGGALLAAASPAMALYLLSPLGEHAASLGEWRGLPKLWAIFTPFMTPSAELTMVTGAAVISLMIVFRRQIQLAPGMPLTLAVLALAFVAAPWSLKGGTHVDMRLGLMLGLLLFAGTLPRIERRHSLQIGLAIALLVVARSAYIGKTWMDHRRDLAEVRAAIANVKPGARVLAARGSLGATAGVITAKRLLPGITRLDVHIAALLLIERNAFWPLLFADPTQQPLIVRPPFDRIAQPLSEPIEWPVLGQESFSPETLRNARYLSDWRSSFDNVLLIDPIPTSKTPPHLSPLYRGEYAALYRIDR